jgi:hypothetical protein
MIEMVFAFKASCSPVALQVAATLVYLTFHQRPWRLVLRYALLLNVTCLWPIKLYIVVNRIITAPAT